MKADERSRRREARRGTRPSSTGELPSSGAPDKTIGPDEPAYSSSVTQLSQLLRRLAEKRSRRKRAERDSSSRIEEAKRNGLFPVFPEYASFWVDIIFITMYIVALVFVYSYIVSVK